MRALFPFLAFLAAPALADEVWTTPVGDVVYERDDNGYIAVLSFPAQALDPGLTSTERYTMHIPGLGGNVTDRFGVYEGYWTGGSGAYCDGAMMNDRGKPTYDWGRVQVIFDVPAFPSGVTFLFGNCFWPPILSLRGETTAPQ